PTADAQTTIRKHGAAYARKSGLSSPTLRARLEHLATETGVDRGAARRDAPPHRWPHPGSHAAKTGWASGEARPASGRHWRCGRGRRTAVRSPRAIPP